MLDHAEGHSYRHIIHNLLGHGLYTDTEKPKKSCSAPIASRTIETVSPEGTFCDTVQIPSSVGDMELI